MQEAFLHYLWQTQRFLTTDLRTTDGEEIRVLKTGLLYADAGPEFINGRLQIGDVEWAGNVEIHVNAAEWYAHKHEQDEAYENVILHVVWENDRDVFRTDGSKIPALEIKDIVSPNLIQKQRQLINSPSVIPCENHFVGVSEFTKVSMLSAALTQRLQTKSVAVSELLNANNSDWEETAYQVLAKNFGFKLNAEPMLQLAKNLPLKILQKHRDSPAQIEALLFGMAGFLESAVGEHAAKLRNEYDFLTSKYSLKDKQLNAHEWKFLRTRPANFPTIRLAQFKSLIISQRSFFSLFTQVDDIELIKKAFEIEQPEYWQQHYHFDKPLAKPLKRLGKSSVDNLLINTVVPTLVCYAQYVDNRELIERAEQLLESLPPENNRITRNWESLDLKMQSSFDTQAGIELYNNFCKEKKCMSCKIGAEILKTTSG
ncbi:MAG: DUF2851 family protein [Spirosomataceae bacterium]